MLQRRALQPDAQPVGILGDLLGLTQQRADRGFGEHLGMRA
jgi:hypothetical protein